MFGNSACRIVVDALCGSSARSLFSLLQRCSVLRQILAKRITVRVNILVYALTAVGRMIIARRPSVKDASRPEWRAALVRDIGIDECAGSVACPDLVR